VKHKRIFSILIVLMLAAMACRIGISRNDNPPTGEAEPAEATAPVASTQPADVTRQPVQADGDEPTAITGEIPYTSPFFLATTAEPYVMLEDQAGFVNRDREFEFSLPSQVIGPVDKSQEGRLTFTLTLPSVPQATFLDVDNNGREDTGVQIFAVAYWSNTWGDPFLEERDGTGWSTAYASTVVDPERENEITGGTLVIWAPNDSQSFPSDFGEDDKLFTEDDPTTSVPAGYSLVDLDERPFRIYKESLPALTLNEGATAVNDFSQMDYAEAFTALFDQASKEYPFTEEKDIDWQALREEYVPQAEEVSNDQDFYNLLRRFTLEIPDGHVGLALNQQTFFDTYGGGFGMTLAELSDGSVIVVAVLPELPAERAGIQPGATILQWDGRPVGEAITAVVSGFGPYSAPHTRRAGKVMFLTRTAPARSVTVRYRNPGGEEAEAQLQAVPEYDSLFRGLSSFNEDPLALPVEAQALPDSGLGYIRISTFQDDYNLMARVWERYIQNLIDGEIPGVIIDVRNNGGGSLGMALQYAGYFFDDEFELYQNFYYNENTGKFEATERTTRVEGAPLHYEGRVAVLVGTNCVSACEGFAYAMQQQERAIIVGHTPSAGAFGEVGQGQYRLPGDLTMQLPTGRSQTLTGGEVVLEGTGVVPDVQVPVTAESALGQVDAVLQAAVEALMNR
jgi:C-terminal processing protease CtpA/Prc